MVLDMRKITKEISIGNVIIGGKNPIAIQSMTNTKTDDVESTLKQIRQLEQVGCDIVRVAVPNILSANCISEIVKGSSLPVVADIHFDADLAITSIEKGANKIRINPGNMPQSKLMSIIACAKEYNVPIRIGVNSGSVDKDLLCKYGNKYQALTESLLSYIDLFEQLNFTNIVLSVKSTSVNETIEINKLVSSRTNYPLHIGLTEAGVPEIGITKNAVAIGSLLSLGIGDTIRVSLTADPVQEVLEAKRILSCLELRNNTVEFVSCPKCGRCCIDLEKISNIVYNHVKDIPRNLKIAVMGCEVNGPGECLDADIGLAGGKRISFFKHGKIYKTVDQDNAIEEFLREVDELTNDT